MSNINRKSVTKQTHIKDCLYFLRSNKKLTENTKTALWEYANYRFNKRNHSNFSSKRLQEMTEELLEYILHKDYKDITQEDILINENRIIYEVGRAIYYGAIHHLYYEGTGIISSDDIKVRESLSEPVRIPDDEKLERQDVIDYFKGLMI